MLLDLVAAVQKSFRIASKCFEYVMVGTRREPSTNVRARVEPLWRIVGQQGPSSHGSILMSRSARVRAVTVPCMSATTAIIICGHWRDRPKWATVLCVVQTPHTADRG